jgi:hypothetical protein
MNEIYNYIISFLLGEHVALDIIEHIGYTSESSEFSKYKIIIKPSRFFDHNIYGTPDSLPQIPLQIWEEVPILYGEPTVETIHDTIVINADLVASTYFLISRYEEIVRRDCRDEHGRFPGRESLPYRAGFIDSPIIEEYGKILRQLLTKAGIEVAEPPLKIRKVYLTHDVDQLAHYRSIRGLMAGLYHGLSRPKEGNRAIKSFWGGLKYDPWYTFPWLFEKNNEAKKALGTRRCETVLFIRSGGGLAKEDQPLLLYHTPDFHSLIKLCKSNGVTYGLHSSYDAGIHPKRINDERKILKRIVHKKIRYNRHHFLTCKEPEDMEQLIKALITDDFTMGYADIAGFRLGTCRPVKWINPSTKELTSLTLHPLTIMDGSLSDKRYMFLNAHDANAYCTQLIDRVEKWNGELVVLWHNTSVVKDPKLYHRDLYEKIIEHLKTK